MNGISHKQAIKWIHRRLDGLLSENQKASLDQHLDSCDTCRAYAVEITSLPAHLQDKFRARWDHQLGPSQKVMELVTTQARRFPLRRRVSSGVKLVAGVATLIVMGFLINLVLSRLQSTSSAASETETADNSALAENRLLAFTSGQNGNAEIYIMHPDGSGLTNITNHPAYDGYPFWSPDGKQIAFMSDRDGSPQIYLMEADGSNIIQLTEGEGKYHLDVNRYTPWSPDGRKLIYSYRPPEETRWNLYVLDIDKKTSTALTNEPGEYILPSWSPDGRQIAFTAESDRASNTRDLFIVSSDGSNLVRLTENISAGEIFLFGDYSWSQDGMSITFSTHSYGPVGQSSAYEASLHGSLTVLARTDKFMIDWWNGTTLQEDSEAKTLTWLRSDSSQSTLNLCQSDDSLQGIAYKRSNDGNLVFGSNCSNRGWMLYWANPEGTIVDELLSSPIPADGNTDHIFNMTWSPDDRYLAFVALHTDANSDDSTTLYILDIAKARNDPSLQPLKMTISSGPSWQPVLPDEVVQENPTPAPTQLPITEDFPPIGTGINNGEWIAFIGGEMIPNRADLTAPTLNYHVYMIHPDRSGLTNLTQSAAHYPDLQWSPNGQSLLFMRENPDRNNVTILRHFPGLETGYLEVAPPIVDPDHYGFSWSPNSDKIVFTDASSGNYDIYTVYADGRNDTKLTRLTDDLAQDVGFAWSPDGSQIAFQRLDGEKLSIYVMNEDGSGQREVAHGSGQVKLQWSHDGRSIYASSIENNWLECEGCVAKAAIYRIQLDGPSVHQIYYEEDTSRVAGWYLYETPQHILYFMRINSPVFVEFWGTWFRADGNSVTEIGELDPQQTCNTTAGNVLNESISPNPRFSVISNFCAGGFDLYLADREATTPEKRFIHLLQLPLYTSGQGGDSATLPMGWSPDGRWLIYENAANTTTYLLNIEKAVQDPTTQPIVLIQPEYYTDPSGQVFQSSETVSLSGLAWQPQP